MLIVVFALSFSALSPKMVYAGEEYQDTALDQMGDWFATLGKSGTEKDQILMQRKADRLKHFMERKAEKAGKEAEKGAEEAAQEAEKAGEDVKKGLGF